MMIRLVRTLFIGAVVLLVGFVLWPSGISPVPFHPSPPMAMTGPLAPNERLDTADIIHLNIGFGPEDMEVDAEGNIFGGLEEGQILKIAPDGTQSVIADTGGRPLGLDMDAAGNLIIADAEKGLLSMAPDGALTVLSTAADGMPYGFTDDVDIGPDGMIYFSDASHQYGKADLYADLLETRPNGRLIAYDPASGAAKTLLSDLYFANGVAVHPSGDFVLVNETWAYRVTRYWLKGPKAGSHDIFIDGLPGFPDGIAAGPDGRFYIAIYAPRNPDIDAMHDSPFLKSLIYKLPGWMQPAPVEYGFVIITDDAGTITGSLQDTDGSHAPILTSAEPFGDTLYLGSLIMPQIVTVNLNQETQK